MWEITSNEIRSFQGDGGTPFTQLVDSTIRAHAFVYNLPASTIHTNLRTNVPDGGVDTQVGLGVQGDPTGWMGEKTVWQYKGTERKNVSTKDLRKEVNKEFAKKCIAEGFGYRFCICDNVPGNIKQEWNAQLNKDAQNSNPNAALAMVVDAEDLAAWVNIFPSLILRYFKHGLLGKALHLEAWKQNARAITSTYVSVPDWQPIQGNLRSHSDFSTIPVDAVTAVQGHAGVGKTRLACEFLVAIPDAENLVIYTNDDQHANEIAVQLANDGHTFAILVADECSVESRFKLGELLAGHKKRIRVIAIDNAGERAMSGSPVQWLEKMPEEIVTKILGENFPGVPVDRRNAYSHLTGGFVRLAADMCSHDQVLMDTGSKLMVLPSIYEYYRLRLNDEQRKVVEALSLVTKTGFTGEVANEVSELCNLLELNPKELIPEAKKLHDAPGFVGMAGRFFYVTPQIIAQVAFNEAWRRWAEDSPEDFLKRLPASLIESFIKRVRECGKEEVCRLVGDFFQGWFSELVPFNLRSIDHVKRLIAITETDPLRFLSILQKLIVQAEHDDLLRVIGTGIDGWGPRRHLVWLLEGLGRFPEYFDDVEAALLPLAVAESEPAIGNNATAIWKQFFRIFLSGTAVAFGDRLQRLRERIYSPDERVSSLALDALDQILESRGLRMAGPPIIAGRIPPAEWNPKTAGEQRQCYAQAIALLEETVTQNNHPLHSKILETVIQNIRQLLRGGYLDALKRIFSACPISDESRVKAITGIEECLHYDLSKDEIKTESGQKYVDEIKAWLETFRPSDVHGRLVNLVGIDPWYHSMMKDEDSWQKDLLNLAGQFLASPESLQQEFGWLCSPDARSAGALGFQLGFLDTEGRLLDLIVSAGVKEKSSALASGYISKLLEGSTRHATRLNEILDAIEGFNGPLAFEFATAGGDRLKALERGLRLVDEGRIPTEALGVFSMGMRDRPLVKQEFAEVLKRFLTGVDNHKVWRLAITFIELRLHRERKDPQPWSIHDADICSLVWQVLDHAPAVTADAEAYHWAEILEAFINTDAEKVAKVASQVLIGEGFHLREQATTVLVKTASGHPDLVMKELGTAMLDKDKGWLFNVDVYRGLINALPCATVIEWIKANGIEAARRVARHVPKPHLDASGNPIVEPLTKFVLSTFGSDEKVFNAFYAGVHSLQLYSGDIAAEHEMEATIARKFRAHPLAAIRKWAKLEEESSLYQAKSWREESEERKIE